MTRRARARRRLLAGALLCGVLAPAPLTGCAESVDPIERLGRKAAEKLPPRGPGPVRPAPPACGPATPSPAKEPRPRNSRCPGKATAAPAPPWSTPHP
ncbi:hypothetical protein JQK87_21125 [Streptomyces sp. G44]|uniref:hypothetical protein n=1 Tax=Streptomyces sp. G44 TaxID=2807632 RepID=UPI00195F4C5E|nr:hypothetical protein [Streptomyces sp. G44]MBM7170850.1 hypothetical protein [Streptomyces sp. G44]